MAGGAYSTRCVPCSILCEVENIIAIIQSRYNYSIKYNWRKSAKNYEPKMNAQLIGIDDRWRLDTG